MGHVDYGTWITLQQFLAAEDELYCKCPFAFRLARFGYIASETSSATGHGTAECPFRIRAAEGQRIRLSMVYFAGGRRSVAESSSSSSAGADEDLESLIASGRHLVTDSTCYEIGTAWTHREVPSSSGRGASGGINSAVAKPQTLTACGMSIQGGRNEQNSGSGSSPHVLFDSDSNEIIVQLNLRTVLAELPPFVIKYEGRAFPQSDVGHSVNTRRNLQTRTLPIAYHLELT
jgi:hypothetical protein